MRTLLKFFILFTLLGDALNSSSVFGQGNKKSNSIEKTKSTTAVKKTISQKGASSSESKDVSVESSGGTSHVIEFDDKEEDSSARSENRPIERLFKNPVLASGINSGADAINRSIDTLMESLFYALLDNNFKWDLTGTSQINLSLTRDVYTARSGSYVVVDRFGIGPSYGKELYRYNDLPVSLGANQSSDILDIYLRSDPMRVNANRALPWWRVAINNWFGILPLLEAVLPPSFNANEMYDPLNRLEAPFKFPLSLELAKQMDVGSIKSFSLNGGINLGIEIGEGIHGYKDIISSGANGLDINLPLSIFRTGEYRINVLKKDSNTVWVGLVDITRFGRRIETKIGKKYFLLQQTIPFWPGLPAPIFPIDLGIEDVIADMIGTVYSFDLQNEESRTAYLEAVHGNFAPAHISWLRYRENKFETGVRFFHIKKERRFETSIRTGHNVFIANKQTNRAHSDAEIEITDRTGKYYILEAKQDYERSKFDMLTGRAEKRVTLQADLYVRKVFETESSLGMEKNRYEFVAFGNPMDVVFNFSINDKFVETEDFANYLEDLSRFTLLKTNHLASFDLREPKLLSDRRRKVYFNHDQDRNSKLQVTPTHLGRFEGYAAIRMSNDQLMKIARKPREDLWRSFCKAFEVSNMERCLGWEDSLFWRNTYRMGGFIMRPFRLIDLRWESGDTVDEIESSVAALKRFAKLKTPEEKQSAMRSFFATEYPVQRVSALLLLSDLSQIPRSIELETDPKGNAPDEIKDRFRRLNGKRILGEADFPPPLRFDSTKDTENKFDPANLTFAGIRPKLRRLKLYRDVRSPSGSAKSKKKTANPSEETPVLAIQVSASNLEKSEAVKIYVRLEQSGKVQLAKLKLIEEVVDIPVAPDDDESLKFLNRKNFVLKLSGAESQLATVISNEAISSGGEFKLAVSVSTDGLLWSEERSLEFRLEDGLLRTK